MAKVEIPVAEALRRLRLFNEKAEKLQRSSFVGKVFQENHSITIHFGENKPLIVEKRGSDEESTDALSLTLRFFFNKKDQISLEQMGALYNSLPIPDEEKRKARDAFARYHDFLQFAYALQNTGISWHCPASRRWSMPAQRGIKVGFPSS